MVNTMDLGRGFLKLQEDNNSRRSSSLCRHKPFELNENGLHYVTRFDCGCGQCVPFRVKVEKDDGGLRIGKLSLATNCHLIIVIFGFFFLIAGSVLTALAYKEISPDPDLPLHARASVEQLESPSRQEGKVSGPIFIIFGSILVLLGLTLSVLACRLNREAKRQLHLSRFTWETPPIQTPDIFGNGGSQNLNSENFAMFANNMDTYSIRSREFSTCSANSAGRRDSSFTFSRQGQHPPPPLSTIAQAVPVGVFLFGQDTTASPLSPVIQVTDPSGFQEIELGSPITSESAPCSATARRISSPFRKQHRSQSDGASVEDISRANAANSNNSLNPNHDPITSQSKINLALRPSLPIIPMFASTPSPHYFSRGVTPLDARNLYVNSRSDEPFGSIASLSTSGDIACFPITSPPPVTSSSVAVSGTPGGLVTMQPTAELEENTSSSSSTPKNNSKHSMTGANINNANNNSSDYIRRNNQENVKTSPHVNRGISELPPINVNEYGSKINTSRDADNSSYTNGFRPKSILRQTKSEDWQEDSNSEKPKGLESLNEL